MKIPDPSSFLIEIQNHEFEKLRRLVHQKFGLNLTEQKVSLVRGRLTKLLRQKGMNSFTEYLAYLERDTEGTALTELMDRLTTNHTAFYREPHTFTFLESHCLPEWIERAERGEEIRLWSAACSSGEEPYTLALLLLDRVPPPLLSFFRILATDLSLKVLQEAVEGCYAAERVLSLPESWRRRFSSQADTDRLCLSQEVRSLVTFKRLNLMLRPFPFRKKFAAILCRNVMIYFDTETRQDLVQRLVDCLEEGGWLFTGHSESLGPNRPQLHYVEPAIYRKYGSTT